MEGFSRVKRQRDDGFLSGAFPLGSTWRHDPAFRKRKAQTYDPASFGRVALMMAPLWQHIHEVFQYPPNTDSSIYARAADFMVSEQSLSSYDSRILGTGSGDHYLYQPGYKYYLAGMLWLSGGQINRTIQFTGGFIIVLVLVCALRKVRLRAGDNAFPLFLFFIGIIPVMTRSMLMGLTEWLAILFFLAAYVCADRHRAASLVLLGLAVFVRQTFLPVALLASIPIIFEARQKTILVTVFLLSLSIPLWHNVVYVDSWRYFADYSWWADLMGMEQQEFFFFSMIVPYKFVFFQYVGIDIDNFILTSFLMGLMFIPSGWHLLFRLGKEIARGSRFWLAGVAGVMLLLLIFSLAYNGSAWFPRFQLFNFTAFIFLYLIGRERMVK